MKFEKILLYGSLVALSLVSPKEISAEACIYWNLPIEIDESGEFIKEKTRKVSCEVDPNYRNWENVTDMEMRHDMEHLIVRIDYRSGKKFYSEFWKEGKLVMLLADQLYHFNLEESAKD